MHPQCQERCPTTTWCLPLSPECHTKARMKPASKIHEDGRGFAETEIAAPTPHVRGKFLHRRVDADALCPSCDLPDSPLKTGQGLWRDCALDLWSVCEAESEELPLLRFRHRTLCLVHFEFELLRDEFRDALHHSLTGSLASHVDIAIICVTNIAMSTALQLPIEFIEFWSWLRSGGRLWSRLWSRRGLRSRGLQNSQYVLLFLRKTLFNVVFYRLRRTLEVNINF